MRNLRCEDLSAMFGGTHALDGISVEFAPSRATAIIGPNGAGKTTLLNTMTGYVRPDTGRVMLGSTDLIGLLPHQIARRGIGRTFQEVRVINRLSVLDHVLLAYANPLGESLLSALYPVGKAADSRNRAEAFDVLRLVSLDRLAEEPAATLSYGQQRLLGIACCVAMTSEFLLLDEPLAGLHPTIVETVLGVVRHLRQQGKTVIFVEHDFLAVKLIADEVIVMANGRIVAQGSANEVLRRSDLLGTYLE